MSTDHDAHLILHHLDDPLRFLHWTLDEAVTIIGPTFFGLGVDHPLLGLLAAGTCYGTLIRLKKRVGFDNLKHAAYWYLPKSGKRLPTLPPSYIREFSR